MVGNFPQPLEKTLDNAGIYSMDGINSSGVKLDYSDQWASKFNKLVQP